MISVAYDATPLALNPFGGIARVCRHTLEQAIQSDQINPCALYRRGDRENIRVSDVTVRKASRIDYLRLKKYDIVHALGHRIPPARCCWLVYTLYDVWSLYPNRYQSPEFQRKIGTRMQSDLAKANAVVCISQTTRAKLLELDLIEPQRVHLARMGVSPAGDYDTDTTPDLLSGKLTRPFVLFVGRIEVRKNIGHIVEALLPLSQLDLVIVGEPGYGYDEIAGKHLAHFPSDRLHVFSQLPESDLDWLYRHTLATLLPSWEEGFGLPILEAMVRGCPVITSNCSASAEVAATGAILVDPSEPVQSRNTLQKLFDDESFRNQLVEAGRKRVLRFGWENYFKQLVGIYHQLVSR